MLSCREVTRRASEYVDRELPLRERLAVQFHLLMCVKCRRLVRHVRCLVASLAQRPQARAPSPDDAYIEKIVARLPTAGSRDEKSDSTP